MVRQRRVLVAGRQIPFFSAEKGSHDPTHTDPCRAFIVRPAGCRAAVPNAGPFAERDAEARRAPRIFNPLDVRRDADEWGQQGWRTRLQPVRDDRCAPRDTHSGGDIAAQIDVLGGRSRRQSLGGPTVVVGFARIAGDLGRILPADGGGTTFIGGDLQPGSGTSLSAHSDDRTPARAGPSAARNRQARPGGDHTVGAGRFGEAVEVTVAAEPSATAAARAPSARGTARGTASRNVRRRRQTARFEAGFPGKRALPMRARRR